MNQSFPGIYEMVNVINTANGVSTEDPRKGGLFSFSPEGDLCLLNSTDSFLIAYQGKYRIEGSDLKFKIGVSSIEEHQGNEIIRHILKNDGKELMVQTPIKADGSTSVIAWRKVEDFSNPIKTQKASGVYELKSLKRRTNNGEWYQETVFGGSLVQTEGGRICAVFRTSGAFTAYIGKYKVENGHELVDIEQSYLPEMNGTQLRPEIIKLDTDTLVIRRFNERTQLHHEVEWGKVRGF